MTSLAVGNRRLLKLADVLDTADAEHKRKGEPTYSQIYFNHSCGTPACALGHACAIPAIRRAGMSERDYLRSVEVFCLSNGQWHELFDSFGCGEAKTAKQAARYIRAFVRRRSQSPTIGRQAD